MSRERSAKGETPSLNNAPDASPSSRWTSPLWWLAGILTFWSFGFTTMLGSDLWWHLASGRWIWQSRTLQFKDPWSFTFLGKPWQSHEWLSDVVFHAWSQLAGMESLVWWKWGVLVAAFLTLFAVLRILSGSPIAAFLASLLAMAVGAPFFDLRPQLYSVLGFALLLRLALVRSRWRWLLPVLFLFWVNLHGGFFFGLLTLTTLFAVARLRGQATKNDLPLWLGCLGACLVNPAGPDAFVFPLHYALKPDSPYLRIGEWRPPWEAGGIRATLFFPLVAIFAGALVTTVVTKLHRRDARLTFTGVALSLLALAMALKSRRFIPLFAMAQSLVLAPVLALLFARVAQGLTARFPRLLRLSWPIVFPSVAIAVGAAFLWPYPLSSRAFLYLTSQDNFPVEALNVAETNQWAGKVFAYYEWGGYVDLRTHGRLQVYIDGRADTVFDDQTLRRYTKVLNAGRDWQKIVEGCGADFFLWPKRRKEQIEALRASGWQPLYGDHVAVLLMRPELPKPPTQPSPESPWRQLMLGWHATNEKDFPAAERHFERALGEMPNLRAACEWLANAQSKQDRLTDAERTLDRCQKQFPDKARREQLSSTFRRRADPLN